MAEIEMTIDSIRVSATTNQKVVILKEKGRERYLPMWIGMLEADSIAIKMQNVPMPRPLTHDVICSIINVAGLKIKSVIIAKLEADRFYAKLVMTCNDKSHEIDCRPSDALAVAVRIGVPIFADEEVLDTVGIFLEEEEYLE